MGSTCAFVGLFRAIRCPATKFGAVGGRQRCRQFSSSAKVQFAADHGQPRYHQGRYLPPKAQRDVEQKGENSEKFGERVFLKNAKLSPGGITYEQEMKLSKLTNLVINYDKANITAIKTRGGVYSKHMLNTLVLLPILDEIAKARSPMRIIDVGTGAGFPGLPVSIMRPAFLMSLLDATKKKCNFHALAIEELMLDNVDTIWGRAEYLATRDEYRESFDVTLSRAVAELRVLAELTLPLTKVGGVCIAMKVTSA